MEELLAAHSISQKEPIMTSLRQRMTEDMQVRNLALNTQTSYLRQVSLFARHFNQSPEALGPEEIRAYQVYLTNEKDLSTSSILVAISALRFVYNVSLKKKARLGNLWVTGGISALGLSEEAVEFAAGGVEGALLVRPAVMDQRPAVIMDHVEDQLFRGFLSETGLFVHVADDLPAEQPHIVDMVLDGSFRQAGLGEVKEEGHAVCDEPSAGRKILVLAHPTLRPLRKIAAIAAVGQ
jgi:hypothetical protein